MGIFSPKTKKTDSEAQVKPAAVKATKSAKSAKAAKNNMSEKSAKVAVAKTSEKSSEKAVAIPVVAGLAPFTTEVIVRPRITEKAGIMTESLHAYTFEVTQGATKPQVSAAIKAMYKVNPVKVRVINLPARQVFVRGKRGTQAAIKKAIVYLKKGETIQLA